MDNFGSQDSFSIKMSDNNRGIAVVESRRPENRKKKWPLDSGTILWWIDKAGTLT